MDEQGFDTKVAEIARHGERMLQDRFARLDLNAKIYDEVAALGWQ